MVSLTFRPLHHRGKSPRYPLDRRLGGPQSLSGRYGEMKILDSNSDPSVVQVVASRYTTNTDIPRRIFWITKRVPKYNIESALQCSTKCLSKSESYAFFPEVIVEQELGVFHVSLFRWLSVISSGSCGKILVEKRSGVKRYYKVP
jgi:hypothetical protein